MYGGVCVVFMLKVIVNISSNDFCAVAAVAIDFARSLNRQAFILNNDCSKMTEGMSSLATDFAIYANFVSSFIFVTAL